MRRRLLWFYVDIDEKNTADMKAYQAKIRNHVARDIEIKK